MFSAYEFTPSPSELYGCLCSMQSGRETGLLAIITNGELMYKEDNRKHERVETNVRVKLPGDTIWTECTTSNVSSGGLLFESVRQLNVGDFVSFQFMLQLKSGTHSNIHFFASSRVIRIIPKADTYQIAVEFIVDEDVRKEIRKLVEIIKSQNLIVERPAASDALFRISS